MDLANDARLKSVCTGLYRALKSLRQAQASQCQRSSGVSLVMLLRWVWPFAKSTEMADILSWICIHELNKISFPDPEIIDAPDRKQILGIFQALTTDGEGYLTSKDFAGGERPDKLKNIVDAETVQAVCGDGMNENEFLEMLCEEGFRGHPEATRVFLKDGSILERQRREAVGFSGWMLKDPPSQEDVIRRRVDALEAEVRRWREIALVEDCSFEDVEFVNEFGRAWPVPSPPHVKRGAAFALTQSER